jgi:hypothetical protein
MAALGVSILAVILAILAAGFLRARKRALPVYGWLALAALIVAEILMFRGVQPVATYFTPIAWTCYIVLIEAAVYAITGHSRLRDAPGDFVVMALLSIPLWMIFEAYNLRLENWAYVGLPENLAARWFGYGWSFATITPGILVTADLIESFGWFRPGKASAVTPPKERAWMASGALLLLMPVVLPRHVAAYLFALVWLGFIFLLDPVNRRRGWPSLLADFERGYRGRFWSLLLSGWACGFLWEFWNYWTAAKWIYIFPMFQSWKIFEMPAPGFLGFLPFAVECFTMYVFTAGVLGMLRPMRARPAENSAPAES